jgi:hypothetical protein
MTHRYVNADPSVQSSPDGTVSIYWYESGAKDRAVELVLDPWAALVFMRSLASAVASSLDNALDAALIGPCERCKNVRLVDVVRPHGRGTESIYCPECRPRALAIRERYAESVFALRETGDAL